VNAELLPTVGSGVTMTPILVDVDGDGIRKSSSIP